LIERYTEKAIKVVLLAQEEAFIAKHARLYPEHILLGILREGSGISAKLLKASGVDVDILRGSIGDMQSKTHELPDSSETMPLSPPVKKILREAWYEVQSSGTYYITPENLFLSLLREKESSVVFLLKSLSVDVPRIKNTVEKIANKSIKPFNHPEESSNANCMSAGLFEKNILLEDEQLKNVMESASKLLSKTNHESFGTEQIFMAILRNKDNWLSEVLESEGVNTENFQRELEQINSRKYEYNDAEPDFTPKAYKALAYAHDIAKELGSTYLKPEHVLLGILKENSGLACRAMKDLQVNFEGLSKKILLPIQKEKPEVLTILKLAREEARRMEQNIVGTEQILLGILGEGTGIGARVLRILGVTLKDARIEVQKAIGIGQNYSEEKEMVFTPRAKRIIAHAWDKAKKLKRSRVSSEHLLLGITREKESIAMKVLENLGVDILEIRQGILNEMKKGDISGETIS
jgi:ATP-dependent Clp protease ATP-binding subunit ClpA